jgi:AcrR family transcriptional regulator
LRAFEILEHRFGRPPKELAGEVDARILDAARKIFLERGFEGASIDEIAEVARSGKPTIYARFRDKRALFTEVVTRDILSRITEFKTEVPTGVKSDELSSLPALAQRCVLSCGVQERRRELSLKKGERRLGPFKQYVVVRSH